MTPQQWTIFMLMMRKAIDDRNRALQLNAMNRAERDWMYTVIQRYRLDTGILS